MVLRKIGRLLAVCGMLMMVYGTSALVAIGAQPIAASAAPLLQPSPRPTLAPTPRSHGGSSPVVGSGRITGTIIDLTTGAPTPGIKVNVGGVVVTSDSNGNYDIWVDAGSYAVALVLSSGQGTPAQAQQMVDVAAGATIVLHLSFTGPAAVSATPAAAKDAPAAPAATAAPVAPLSARADGGTSRVHAAPRLPRTGEQDTSSWAWIALGAMLLMGGIALELGRKRLALLVASAGQRAIGYENARLLASLLTRGMRETQPVQARAAENDMLLAALLTHDMREGQTDER